MAKMDKAEDCSSSIPGSSPGAVSRYGFVAQSVERGIEDPGVVRSTRTEATRTIDVALGARRQRSALPRWCHDAASVGSGRHNRIRKHLRHATQGAKYPRVAARTPQGVSGSIARSVLPAGSPRATRSISEIRFTTSQAP